MKKFPRNGTFFEQEKFVESLPTGTNKKLHKALNIIEEAQAPLNLSAEAFSKDVEIKMMQHKIISGDDSDSSDSDSDEEKSVAGVVTRNVHIKHEKKQEKSVVHVPTGANESQVFKMKFGKDGSVSRITRRNRPINDFAEGLKNNKAGNEKEGFVASASTLNDDQTLMTTFTRSTKSR